MTRPPKAVHAFYAVFRGIIGCAPDRVPVHIHNRKIEKEVYGLGLPGLEHHVPIEMQPIGIEQTQSAVELHVLDGRKQLLCEVRCCVVRDNIDITSALTNRCEVLRFVGVHVDEIKMVERWGHFEGARGTAFHLSARPLRHMDTGPAECIHVVFFNPFWLAKALVYAAP